jgi:hypothetical protein
MRSAEMEVMKRLLAHIGANHEKPGDSCLAGFLAMIGNRYEGELR